jgi:hypothetical protein
VSWFLYIEIFYVIILCCHFSSLCFPRKRDIVNIFGQIRWSQHDVYSRYVGFAISAAGSLQHHEGLVEAAQAAVSRGRLGDTAVKILPVEAGVAPPVEDGGVLVEDTPAAKTGWTSSDPQNYIIKFKDMIWEHSLIGFRSPNCQVAWSQCLKIIEEQIIFKQTNDYNNWKVFNNVLINSQLQQFSRIHTKIEKNNFNFRKDNSGKYRYIIIREPTVQQVKAKDEITISWSLDHKCQ